MNISDKNITTLLESRNEQALKLLSAAGYKII